MSTYLSKDELVQDLHKFGYSLLSDEDVVATFRERLADTQFRNELDQEALATTEKSLAQLETQLRRTSKRVMSLLHKARMKR